MTLQRNMTVDDEAVDLRDGEQFIELPDGERAILRNPKKVPESKRRPITIAAATADEARTELGEITTLVGDRTPQQLVDEGVEVPSPSEETLGLMFSISDLLVVACVREWSFDEPITVEGYMAIDGDSYDMLQELCAPMFNTVVPSFGAAAAIKGKEDGGPGSIDPASPSVPSAS